MAGVISPEQKVQSDAIRAHGVLKHLDALKPVLQLDFNYVKLVYERLTKSKPPHILLNYYDVLVVDVLKIFPNQAIIMHNLIKIFQFHKPHFGMSIMVLDILTILSVLTTGSVTEKSKLLFAMYNINQTGLMDEDEHVNFILRITECMRKLKLMGLLDITAPDAKFIALEARVKYDNNQITFVPGLYVADFTRWVQTSKECQTLFKFTRVLTRLVDSLHVLENRTNALLSVMEAKNQYLPNSRFVPSLDLFKDCVKTNASIYVIYRSQNIVSVSLPLLDMEETEVYIKLDKVVPCMHTRYDIPRSILKKNVEVWKANSSPELECCRKGILLTSFRCQHIDALRRQRNHNMPYQRVDIPDLDAGCVYMITVYTSRVQYRTLQVHTTALAAAIARCVVAPSIAASRKTRHILGGARGDDEEKGGYEEVEEGGAEEAAEDSEREGDEDGHQASGDSSDEGSTAQQKKKKKEKKDVTTSKVQSSALPFSVSILPASLSAEEAEAFCKYTCPGAANTTVFTGTVCSMQQVIATLI